MKRALNVKAKLILICGFLFWNGLYAQETLRFSSFDSLLAYADEHSVVIKTGEEQSLLAKWTKIASFGNTVNLRSTISGSWTDNTLLPVSYLPGEVFGGAPGSFKAVSLGQEFVTNYGFTPQLDIINPAAWAKVKSAGINKELTAANQQIARKNLFESIAACYYNIISIQDQLFLLKQSENAADSILVLLNSRFKQDLIREQDVNNARINLLNIRDKIKQLGYSLEQNYNSLKILCDMEPGTGLEISSELKNTSLNEFPKAKESSLYEKQFRLQSEFLKNELRVNRLATYSPSLSLVFNQAWQQNSNLRFADNQANKFTTQYIGLRLSVPFPLDVNRISQNYNSRVSYSISRLNVLHQELQRKYSSRQLDLDLEKARSSYETAKEICELKETNYQKSENQYRENMLSTDLLLLAFSDKVNAQLTCTAALAALKFAESKINLNNTIQ